MRIPSMLLLLMAVAVAAFSVVNWSVFILFSSVDPHKIG